MPSWKSVLGKWFPAKEYHVNPNLSREDHQAGVSAVYEGPDRAASEILKELGVEHLGEDYHLNQDLIRRSRELGFDSVDKFLKTMYNIDPIELQKRAERELAETTIQHKNPAKKKPIREIGGGYDSAGKNPTRMGDFGEPADVPVDSLKKRA